MTSDAFCSLEHYEGPGRCGGSGWCQGRGPDTSALIGGVVGGLFGLVMLILLYKLWTANGERARGGMGNFNGFNGYGGGGELGGGE